MYVASVWLNAVERRGDPVMVNQSDNISPIVNICGIGRTTPIRFIDRSDSETSATSSHRISPTTGKLLFVCSALGDTPNQREHASASLAQMARAAAL